MHRITLVAAVLCLSSSLVHAQEKPLVELGIDGALNYVLSSPSQTSLSVPVSNLRGGLFVSPEWSIEPSLRMAFSTSSSATFTSMTYGVGALYHFSTSRTAMQPYVRPFLNYTYASSKLNGQSGSSSTNASVGAGLGVKIPMYDRLMWRVEGAYANQVGESHLMALFGLSFFTR